MKRCRGPVAMVALFLGVAAIVACLLREDRICQASYERIRLGMSLSQAAELLGPPVDLALDRDRPAVHRTVTEMLEEGGFEHRPDDNDPGRRWLWTGRNSSIMVRVDAQGTITDRLFIGLKPLTLIEQLRAFVRL